MNMKKILSTAIMAFTGLVCLAQANKPVVTVEQFTSNNVNSTIVESVRNKVLSALQEAGRVNVVDVKNESALNAEQARRTDERAMDDAGRVEDMTKLMSNSILKGNIDNLTVTKKTEKGYDDKMHTYYTAVLNYTLNLVNAGNGTLISQKNFSSSYKADTDALAIQGVVDIRTTPIKQFILNAYAVGGKVIAMDDGDAKKAKTVYIDLGKDDGISKGQKMTVFKEVDIAGEKSKKEIGEIQVQEVMGGTRSLCKVTKGGDVILKEIEAGSNLPIETKEQKSGFFKSMWED